MSEFPLESCATPMQAWLFDLTLHGMKLGLDNIRHLLAAAGNPHKAYPAVHVAGTNGKGSVLACLDPMLRAAGYRTGRFTSPHILALNERFLVNGAPAPNEQVDAAIARYRAIAENMDPPPTFFELCTAVAFLLFAEEAVDMALIEVGMGGRLDSTNVLAPVLTAITTIDLEHTQYLGDTLEAIAGEKAGIIKPRTPVVIGRLAAGPSEVITARAAELDAPLKELGHDFDYRLEGGVWRQAFHYLEGEQPLFQTPLPFAGRHQGENAAVACALAQGLGLAPAPMAVGLAKASWPCRLEQVLDAPPVIIDVAHNVAGAKRLAEALDQCVVIISLASDKDVEGILAQLAPCGVHFILTQFNGKRALPLAELELAAAALPSRESAATLEAALEKGLERASENLPLLITGSIYTAAEARTLLIHQYGAPPLRF